METFEFRLGKLIKFIGQKLFIKNVLLIIVKRIEYFALLFMLHQVFYWNYRGNKLSFFEECLRFYIQSYLILFHSWIRIEFFFVFALFVQLVVYSYGLL